MAGGNLATDANSQARRMMQGRSRRDTAGGCRVADAGPDTPHDFLDICMENSTHDTSAHAAASAAATPIGPLELVEYPHPALLRRAKPLLRIDDAVCEAVEQMFEIMYAAEGIGLAANQVALPYRIFIVNTAGRRGEGQELVFINPTLSRPRGTAVQEEGCLSLPGLRMDVRRPERIVVEAWSLDGTPIHLDLEGMLARVVQHEFDHLEGRLFTDRLPEVASIEARRTLESFREVFLGQQLRSALPGNAEIVARLERLEAARCTA